MYNNFVLHFTITCPKTLKYVLFSLYGLQKVNGSQKYKAESFSRQLHIWSIIFVITCHEYVSFPFLWQLGKALLNLGVQIKEAQIY